MAPIYYLLSFLLAAAVVASAVQAADGYRAVTGYQTAEEKTDTLLKDVLEDISFGFYKGATEKTAEITAVEQRAARFARLAHTAAWILLALSAVFLGAHALRARRGEALVPAPLITHLLGVSAVFLVIGLCAPILTVSAREDVALLGPVVLQYETKGILSTVLKLAGTGNRFLAALLFFFSVLAPGAKLIASFVALKSERLHVRRFTISTVDLIGRWSMTDVFVVAVLLAYLAAETEQLTDASVGPGLYFFAGYGVLSLAAGQLMVRHREALVTPEAATPEDAT